MSIIKWQSEIESRKQSLLVDTQNLLKIKSVLDDENQTETAPFGGGVKAALDYMLELGAKDGFVVKNVGNVAGHIEMGEGKELVGILCHVDVVPEGDGWSSDPYGAEIRDGKMYARGAIDDKGPTMAAYYAMKVIKELGLPLQKRVRMIIGTDEESQWRCVNHYFEVEEMPTLGFAPDADFPIINAEKGIWDFAIVQSSSNRVEHAVVNVVEFSSGRRMNMVPDHALAKVKTEKITELIEAYKLFLEKHSLKGKVNVSNHEMVFELKGLSAHGMEPNNGVNAGLYLASFLADLELDSHAKAYFSFIRDYLFDDSRGNKLGVAFQDEITGDLTLNAGKFHYSKIADTDSSIGFTMRYPVTYNWEMGKDKLTALLAKLQLKIASVSNSTPHHVDKDSFLIQTLQKVYEEATGEKAELLSIGGGTYARSLKEGVAFGPLFPGSEDIAHQKDEYIDVNDMLKAAVIYAMAIYELAK